MSDHGAGPRSIANPEIDITDVFAFPSPERPGHLVLAMNIFPFKEIEATRLLFSDADYRIRVRPVRVASTGPIAAFTVGEEERAFSFIFEVPQASGDSLVAVGHLPRTGRQDFSPRRRRGRSDIPRGLHIFAGCRLDPFFIDQLFSGGIRLNRRIPEVNGVNSRGGPERTQYRR